MINIKDKQHCCGCASCVQKCPKRSISLHEDNEGFLYPYVDTETCTDCGLCEKVCPVLNPYKTREPLQILAAINKDEKIRMESSSGGIFSLLAEKVINEGGVVFGARFDEKWQVTIDYTETKEGLTAFRGSKYVQARTADTYSQCEKFLKDGRKVLYTGTPCQIAGLKHFLRKEYDNLLTVDILCHGVPSPKVWAMYLGEVIKNTLRVVYGESFVPSFQNQTTLIKDIKFREKSNGWRKFRFVLTLKKFSCEVEKKSVCSLNSPLIDECFNQNIYMKAFLEDLILRPSCYTCPARSGKSYSDITIADYWGIQDRHPEIDDDLGTSLIIIHSNKGKEIVSSADLKFVESSLVGLEMFNGGLKKLVVMHSNREMFFTKLQDTKSISKLIQVALTPHFSDKIKRKINVLKNRLTKFVK